MAVDDAAMIQAELFIEAEDFCAAVELLEREEKLQRTLRGLPETLAIARVCLAGRGRRRRSGDRNASNAKAAPEHNLYSILQVQDGCGDPGLIRTRFRQLALLLHPDKNKHARAEEAFQLVSEAYAVLSDARQRASYDARNWVALRGARPGGRASMPPSPPQQGPPGGGYARQAAQQPGKGAPARASPGTAPTGGGAPAARESAAGRPGSRPFEEAGRQGGSSSEKAAKAASASAKLPGLGKAMGKEWEDQKVRWEAQMEAARAKALAKRAEWEKQQQQQQQQQQQEGAENVPKAGPHCAPRAATWRDPPQSSPDVVNGALAQDGPAEDRSEGQDDEGSIREQPAAAPKSLWNEGGASGLAAPMTSAGSCPPLSEREDGGVASCKDSKSERPALGGISEEKRAKGGATGDENSLHMDEADSFSRGGVAAATAAMMVEEVEEAEATELAQQSAGEGVKRADVWLKGGGRSREPEPLLATAEPAGHLSPASGGHDRHWRGQEGSLDGPAPASDVAATRFRSSSSVASHGRQPLQGSAIFVAAMARGIAEAARGPPQPTVPGHVNAAPCISRPALAPDGPKTVSCSEAGRAQDSDRLRSFQPHPGRPSNVEPSMDELYVHSEEAFEEMIQRAAASSAAAIAAAQASSAWPATSPASSASSEAPFAQGQGATGVAAPERHCNERLEEVGTGGSWELLPAASELARMQPAGCGAFNTTCLPSEARKEESDGSKSGPEPCNGGSTRRREGAWGAAEELGRNPAPPASPPGKPAGRGVAILQESLNRTGERVRLLQVQLAEMLQGNTAARECEEVSKGRRERRFGPVAGAPALGAEPSSAHQRDARGLPATVDTAAELGCATFSFRTSHQEQVAGGGGERTGSFPAPKAETYSLDEDAKSRGPVAMPRAIIVSGTGSEDQPTAAKRTPGPLAQYASQDGNQRPGGGAGSDQGGAEASECIPGAGGDGVRPDKPACYLVSVPSPPGRGTDVPAFRPATRGAPHLTRRRHKSTVEALAAVTPSLGTVNEKAGTVLAPGQARGGKYEELLSFWRSKAAP